MVDGDIPAGLSLCRSAGWNQTAEDWRLFLTLSPAGCCVAVDDEGGVRGTVATVGYGGRFSWIGMVLVDPTHQRQGIGIQLLREALHILQEEETIKLDATPAGRQIYVQLDFQDEYRISRMEAKEIPVDKLEDDDLRPIFPHDIYSLMDSDAEVFGASREPVLQNILIRSPHLAYLCRDERKVKGYCFGRTGHNFNHIGPVIAEDFETAKRVVSAALKSCNGRPVVMDALLHTPEWIAWLSSLGFTEQRPLIRMYRGLNASPGVPEKQFAILGPEFG